MMGLNLTFQPGGQLSTNIHMEDPCLHSLPVTRSPKSTNKITLIEVIPMMLQMAPPGHDRAGYIRIITIIAGTSTNSNNNIFIIIFIFIIINFLLCRKLSIEFTNLYTSKNHQKPLKTCYLSEVQHQDLTMSPPPPKKKTWERDPPPFWSHFPYHSLSQSCSCQP